MDANQTSRKRKNKVVNIEADIVRKRTKTAKNLKLKQPTRPDINKADYLKQFNISTYGHIHEQKWAQKKYFRISFIHPAINFHCTICQEAWPDKSKSIIKQSYVCTRCARDKSVPRKFSDKDFMIPSAVPRQLQSLTQMEEMLIARALPVMSVFIKPGVQRAYSGHCINLTHNVKELANNYQDIPRIFLL